MNQKIILDQAMSEIIELTSRMSHIDHYFDADELVWAVIEQLCRQRGYWLQYPQRLAPAVEVS